MEDAQVWIDKLIDFAVEFGPKVIGAILIYIVGSWVIKKLMKLLRRGMTSQEYDKSLQKFSVAVFQFICFLYVFRRIYHSLECVHVRL